MSKYKILAIVGVLATSMMLGVTWASPVQTTADQPGVTSAPQAAPQSANQENSEQFRAEAQFWRHARDPFAPPSAAQLCDKGMVQACALVLPSD